MASLESGGVLLDKGNAGISLHTADQPTRARRLTDRIWPLFVLLTGLAATVGWMGLIGWALAHFAGLF